jgi:C1A family cysteine protease
LGDVRDQDSIGWCYAFSAADLLSYKLGKKISAADMAMNYNDNWINNIFKKLGSGEQDFEGGWMASSIEATKRKGGACKEEDLRSEDNGYSDIMTTLVDIDKIKRDNSVENKKIYSDALKAMFPNLKPEEYLDIIDKAARADLLNMLSDRACSPRINIEKFKVVSELAYLESGKNKLFNQIDEQLDKENIVSIGYNSTILMDTESEETGMHASLVVGRRLNKENGECEYLVRNSWGRGCSSYDKKLTWEEGNIWVPKSLLVKDILNVTYIE